MQNASDIARMAMLIADKILSCCYFSVPIKCQAIKIICEKYDVFICLAQLGPITDFQKRIRLSIFAYCTVSTVASCHILFYDYYYLNLNCKYTSATSMEMITSPARAIQQQLERQREPEQVRKPKFPRAPLEREDAFIDPLREAQLLLPEQTVASTNIMFDTALSTIRTQSSARRENVFTSIYEYLLAVFTSAKKRIRGNARQRARLTLRGEEALSQLHYLAMLCDAMECRTPEEVLLAEGAFGEAYHEILNLSSNLMKMSEQEQAHHLHHYKKHFSSVLRSTD